MDDALLRCRVCGLLQDDPPWGSDGTLSSFDICDCCGVEFGYQDSTRESVLWYRQSWLQRGGVWYERRTEPAKWTVADQLRQVPPRWR